MLKMIAIEQGFYDGHRRRVGQVFEVDQEFFDRETSRKLGDEGWAVAATPENLARVGMMQTAAEETALKAAIASSGTRFNKPQSFMDVMNAGRGALTGDARAGAIAASGDGASGGVASKKIEDVKRRLGEV